jgi:hypothetical protein
MRALSIAAVLAVLASPTTAATAEVEGYSVTIAPGEPHTEIQKCPTGTLVSGGYSIDSYNGAPFEKVLVILNAPVDDDAWAVGILNAHDAPVTIEFRIILLCE